jgi:hypothetical protein
MILAGSVLVAAPLSPDPDDAREWIERELSDPAYAAAEPTLFDRIARAVGDFFVGLLSPDIPDAWGPAAAVIATVVVAIVVVAALLIWGRPRRAARARPAVGPVFGDDDARSADELRRDAASAAARSDWDEAIVLRFRAIARALAERAIVEGAPGATAQAFARASGAAFPAEAPRLRQAAGAFDDVRYLRRPGSPALYDTVTALDDALAGQRPRAFADVGAGRIR